jgi:anionic cell wall polymer biosynthesis LytR-Cps2A-Psr (LCP) family protein
MLIIISGGVFIYLSATFQLDFLKSKGGEERVIHTLFIIENQKKPLAAYTLLYYPETHRAAIFNIPGDVGRIIKQINRVDRIDIVYNGRKIGDFEAEVESLLGIEIQNTIIFDLASLARTIDVLDGVRIFIPSAVEIFKGADSVLFPSGWTTLDGDKACSYLVYDDEDADSMRQRHQRFFIGLLKRLSEQNEFIKQKQIDKLLGSLMRSSMNHRTRINLFNQWTNIDTDRITVQQISGNYRDVSGETLLIPHYDGGLIKDIVRQTLTALTRQGERAGIDRIITVEVLNGTNISGLAGRTAELIRGFGYDVVNVSNADRSNYEKTQIIDHFNHPLEAENFAEIMHCDIVIQDNSEDEFEEDLHDPNYKADFTLILGRDYNGRFN